MIHSFSNWEEKHSSLYPDFTFAWWGRWLSQPSSDMILTVPSSGKLETWRQHLWAVYPSLPSNQAMDEEMANKSSPGEPYITVPSPAVLLPWEHDKTLTNVTGRNMGLPKQSGEVNIIHWEAGYFSCESRRNSPSFQKCLEWECWAAGSGVLDVITLG